jgi:hypothetical protein
VTTQEAIKHLAALASVRYPHMSLREQRTFLRAVMLACDNPEAEHAAATLSLLEEADRRQLKLFDGFKPKQEDRDGAA